MNDAAQEAGSIVGFNEKTVKRHKRFLKNKSELKQGKYERKALYLPWRTPELKGERMLLTTEHPTRTLQPLWVRQQPAIAITTSSSFFSSHGVLEDSHLLAPSSWFQAKKPQKGGVHWRSRQERCCEAQKGIPEGELRKTHQPPLQCSDEEPRVCLWKDNEKKLGVVFYHDESIYNMNEGQTWMWAE